MNARSSSRPRPLTAAQRRSPLAGAVILIGGPRNPAVDIARSKLRADGASAVLCRRSVDGVAEALQEGGVDLVQLDMDLAGGDPVSLAKQVRFGEVGLNPFVVVMVTTWRAETEVVTAAMSAGADDVVANPVSIMTFGQRIKRFAANRKPFIAANTYIGPVRPRMPPAIRNTRTFEAPNTLKALTQGRPVDIEEHLLRIEAARRRLLALRVEVASETVSTAAAKALASKPEPLCDPDDRAALNEGAAALRGIASVAPPGSLVEAARRLAKLADIAAAREPEAIRAAQVAVEVGEAIKLIVAEDESDALVLPADIIRRMEQRFPSLAVA